jgi:ABC-type multidrug transport system ATPase subunit
LAQALLKDPAVLLVDTPTAGLDPYEQIMVLELLRDVGRERLLVVATNLPDEAVELSDRIVILDRGRVVAEVAAGGLAEAAAGHVFQMPWTFRDRVDGMVVPTPRPEEVLVVTAAPPHQVARPVASSPELGYLYLLWAARRARRSPVP